MYSELSDNLNRLNSQNIIITLEQLVSNNCQNIQSNANCLNYQNYQNILNSMKIVYINCQTILNIHNI